MSSVLRICEKCDAAFAGSVCLKCGNFAESVVDLEPSIKKEDFGFLTSAINENNANAKNDVKIPIKKKNRFILPLILGFLLFGIGSFSYWLFVFTTPDYVSPYVLSASDSRPGDVSNEVVEISNSREKVILLDIKNEEGSFNQYDFAQFASTDTSLVVSAFNISDVISRYFEGRDILKNIKSEFDLSDNDIDVFFSKEFTVYFPSDDFSKWGLAIYTEDKSFVDSKIEVLDKKREHSKFIFKDYFADVVEVKPKVDKIDEEKKDEADQKSEYFLLISNSKEYLDQMKESSEGNLTNLASDIKYSTVKSELPKVGQVFVYRKDNASIWDLFVVWISTKYDYVGLDKILMAIDAPGIVFFSNNSKLKITTADIM